MLDVTDQADTPNWVEEFDGVAKGLVALLGPFVEIAAHDIASDRIVGLWGAASGRALGDPALLSELPDYEPGDEVIGPYEKTSIDGARVVSVSIVIRRSDQPVGMLCINFDRTPLETASALLASIAVPVVDRPAELFERDWREQIASRIQEFCQDSHIDRKRMTRADRLDVVRLIDQAGLFAARNAASLVANAIGASRATVYALLKEARSSQ